MSQIKFMKIPAEFNSLKEIKKIFKGVGRTVGVGVSAFQRAGLGYILPEYEILALLETSDIAAIRQVCPVTVIKGEQPEKLNTSSILKLKSVKNFLTRHANFLGANSNLANPDVTLCSQKFVLPASNYKPLNLFVYKAATPLDRIIKTLPVRLLSASGYIRKPLEDKKIFRQEAKKAGIQIPAGVNLNLRDLTEKKWDKLRQKYGERLVFQLTDLSTGGGKGTFFIDSPEDFFKFKECSRGLTWVNVCQRIEGKAASISGCATRYGTIGGALQTQIIDQPELTGFKGRSGVWLGHDWTMPFSPEAQAKGEALCLKWGEYIYQKGYKGIFGLDVVVKDDQVTAIECNSRYTGAFPVYTMMQVRQGEMPLDVWHLVEWLGLDYEMDINEVQKINRQPKTGAHLILHNLEGRSVRPEMQVKSGLYRISHQPCLSAIDSSAAGAADYLHTQHNFRLQRTSKLCLRKLAENRLTAKFLHPGFSLLDINNADEFVLADRVPNKGQLFKSGERIGKMIFNCRIIDNKGNLLPEIKEIVRQIYQNFSLV